jgi:hypothetical protein
MRRILSTVTSITLLAAAAGTSLYAAPPSRSYENRSHESDHGQSWSGRNDSWSSRNDSRAFARVPDLASEVDRLAQRTFNLNNLRNPNPNSAEHRALNRLRVLAQEARSFRSQVGRSPRAMSRTSDDFADLVRAYVRTANTFRALQPNRQIRQDWKTLQNRMEQLMDIYDYGDRRSVTG